MTQSEAEQRERDLLHEWQASMKAVARTLAGAAGSDAARQLMTPLHRQAELFQELLNAERRLQRELVGRVLGPLDTAFDLLEQSGAALRGQAESLEHAAQALQQTAVLMRTQAELFESTIRTLREPSRMLESAVGVERPRTTDSRAPRA